jgi:hypothetical protein
MLDSVMSNKCDQEHLDISTAQDAISPKSNRCRWGPNRPNPWVLTFGSEAREGFPRSKGGSSAVQKVPAHALETAKP